MKQKMGLFTCLCICVGTIIGAGIFGSLPTAINLGGKGVVLAFLLAIPVLIIRFIPTMMTVSALPADASYYMHTTRMVGPVWGFLQILDGFYNVLLVAALANTLAVYVCKVIPISPMLVAVLSILLFAIISTFGARVNGDIQNIMVAILMVALLLYVFNGLPHIDAANFKLSEGFVPKVSATSFAAAIGLCVNCLLGA